MTKLILALVAGVLVGCGGGEDGDGYRDPESFADPEVLEQAEHALARECITHLYVLEARTAECAIQPHGSPTTPERKVEACNVDPELYGEAHQARLNNCLDALANAPCDELLGPPEEQAEGCAVAESW